jgi:hypothetical protein
MSTFEQPGAPSWPRIGRYDAPPSPPELTDVRTQGEVLARLIQEPDLLKDSFGDLSVDDSVQFELTRYLSDNWVPIIEKDVDGPSSLPLRLVTLRTP